MVARAPRSAALAGGAGTALAPSGHGGGGIVLLIAGSDLTTGTITADGDKGDDGTGGGGGGGGAGGTVIVGSDAGKFSLGTTGSASRSTAGLQTS